MIGEMRAREERKKVGTIMQSVLRQSGSVSVARNRVCKSVESEEKEESRGVDRNSHRWRVR